jgi:Sec-independent protein translocase protein TatA
VIAIFPSLGWQEMFLLLVIGLLLYGRNLPDAGRSLGRVVAQLKRSFHDFKDQLDRDGELGDVKKALKDTAREVKNIAKVPHALTKPGDVLRDLTHEAMTSKVDEPDEEATEPDGDATGEHTPDGHTVEESESEDSDPAEQSVGEPAIEPKSKNDLGADRDETSAPSTGSPGA